MAGGHRVVAVGGHEELGVDLLVDPDELARVPVSGRVHVARAVMDEGDAAAVEVVLQALDGDLVSGNDGGREDDGIARGEGDGFVLLGRDTHERGELLALGAGREDHDLVRRIVPDLCRGDDRLLLHLEEAGLLRDLEIRLYGAAFGDNLLAEALGDLDDADHALELRGEGADDETALHGLDDLLEGLMHLALRDGESVALGVGGVRDEEEVLLRREHAPLLLLGIGRDAVLMIELEVAGSDDVAVRGLDSDAHRIRDRVGDGEELDLGRADSHGRARVDGDDIQLWLVRILLLALLDHHGGEVLRVDRGIAHALHQERDAADVIEVAVRDEDAADAVLVHLEILGVREDVIDARLRVLGHELEADVEDEDVAVGLDGEHVASDLLDAAEGNDAHDVLAWCGREVLRRLLRGHAFASGA